MDLFNSSTNLLPQDGIVNYFGFVLTNDEADVFYKKLMENIEWKNDQTMMFGKLIETKRKVGWYGQYPFEYTYSKITKKALPWTVELEKLKDICEKQTGETYNSCLLNLYHDGSEGMGWHSDGEKDLKKNGSIASMSFGAVRKFTLKHRETAEKVEVILEHGSLLEMAGTCQTHWLHRLPPTTKVTQPRINLTFRTIIQ
ncbi:MAG: alkylated DNA repair dioxygenase AlkB [Algoriphagus sp.]|jgi:alkylated DNA repair dioxygenase AlkB